MSARRPINDPLEGETRPSPQKRPDMLVATESRVVDGVNVVAGVTRVSREHPWAQLGAFQLTTSDEGKAAIEKRSRSKSGDKFWFVKPASVAWR